MRIIAGKFKKARIHAVPKGKTRPTTDFLREMIFSVIQECDGQKVLDLFAGSGSLGLEALSRGAKSALFVDISENSIKTIKQNVEKLRCEANTQYIRKKASAFLKVNQDKFDLIFLDPPYNKRQINPTLALIFELDTVEDGGLIVIEHSRSEKIDEQWMYFKTFERKAGDSMVTILQPEKSKIKDLNDEDL